MLPLLKEFPHDSQNDFLKFQNFLGESSRNSFKKPQLLKKFLREISSGFTQESSSKNHQGIFSWFPYNVFLGITQAISPNNARGSLSSIPQEFSTRDIFRDSPKNSIMNHSRHFFRDS